MEPGAVVVENPDPAVLYSSYYGLLRWIATTKYRVPEPDAEPLIHEVFVSYLLLTRHISEVERWLVGGICNQSRNYWRQRLRDQPPPELLADPRTLEFEDDVLRLYTLTRVLRSLDERCRNLLSRHYLEEATARDLSILLGTSVRYAEKLLHKCLIRARSLYRKLTKVSG